MRSMKIMGRSITCSATGISASKSWSTSTSCSTISGKGPSSVGNPGTASTIWSTVCRDTRDCQPATSDRGAGWPPTALAVFWPRGALYCACSTNSSFDGTARGVVELFSQGHCDAHPFVPKHRTEASLPPPPRRARGTMGAVSTRAIRWVLKHHGHTNKETRV